VKPVALLLFVPWVLAAAPDATRAELKETTDQAFQEYVRSTEARLDKQLAAGSFLWADGDTERARGVRSGKIVVQPATGKIDVPVTDGLIHDWIGAVFIPGTTLEGVLALVQDYDHHQKVYQPEVIDSKLLSRSGNDFQVYLKLLKKKVLTVTLNTYHRVRYVPVDGKRAYSRSYSTRIAEVESGKELPPGDDHGFLWRLDSFWRFEERDGGVYVECEAISLTRSVPTGLGWLINPIIQNLPRESLTNTLRETREALVARK
jgi:hypothetical protein